MSRTPQELDIEHLADILTAGEPEEAAEDEMEQIDTNNIVGSRTRGKTIDFAEAAKNQNLEEDDDDDDDEDFHEDDAVRR